MASDPDPDGALLPYAWRKANNHRGRFALTVGFLTVSSYAALDYFAVPSLVHPSRAQKLTHVVVTAALAGLTVAILSLLIGIAITPIQQRNDQKRLRQREQVAAASKIKDLEQSLARRSSGPTYNLNPGSSTVINNYFGPTTPPTRVGPLSPEDPPGGSATELWTPHNVHRVASDQASDEDTDGANP